MSMTVAMRRVVHLGKKSSCIKHLSSVNEIFLPSPRSEVDIPKTSISELILEKTASYGNEIAAECGITGRRYTYNQWRKNALALAGGLVKKLKLKKGDTVAVLLPNSPEYGIIVLGILRGGLIATTMNPSYTPSEISRQLMDSGAKAIITQSDCCEKVRAAIELTGKPVTILSTNISENQTTHSGTLNLLEFFQQNIDISDVPHPSGEDIALLPYSSGTTGLPKGVELTHSNVVANISQIMAPENDYIMDISDSYQEVVPNILPQFHVYGLTTTVFITMIKGCKNISLPNFQPKTFIETLVKYKPSILFLVPPLLQFLSSHDSVKSDYLSSLRFVMSGAAPFGPSDQERFLKKANKEVMIGQGYGLTETTAVAAISKLVRGGLDDAPVGSTGIPLSKTDIKVIDTKNPSGPGLGPNKSGEILIRGPQIMKGYHNRPKETKETFVGDWLRTGDIGQYDEEGNLTITDRLKELIKVKGFQVPPAELEEVIREYPGVLEVGVIGIPDERYGEVPRAYVTPKPNMKFDEKSLLEYVKTKVSSYKELKGGISLIESIPKNPSGKILRRKLKEHYLQFEAC